MSCTTRWIVLAVSLLAFSGLGRAMAGDITYELVDYSGFQNGWTLTGSITTDGKIGTLSTGDIVSWNYTLSKGADVDTVTSQNGSAIASDLIATSSQLELPYPSSSIPGAELELSGFAQQNQTVEPFLEWSYPNSKIYEAGTISPSFQYFWQTTLPLPGTTSAVIATVVPEPASLALAAMAGLCGIAWRLSRSVRFQGS